MKKISIILPTFNEAGNILPLIKSILTQLRRRRLTAEIVIVDDDSPDHTAAAVKKLRRRNIKLYIRKHQRGLATAILYGLRHSNGNIIVFMDTDFNHQPKDIPRLIKPLLTGTADIVIGSRYMKGGGMHMSEAGTLQFLSSKLGNFFVNKILLDLPVKESLSGFVVIKRKTLTKLNLASIFQGYGDYCIRLLYHAYRQGYRLTEIPVVYGKRRYGQSKSNLIKMFMDYSKTALDLKFNKS